MQYDDLHRELAVDFATEGGFLWRLSSILLFWEDSEKSCAAVGMLPLGPSVPRASGSLAILWPLLLSLAYSRFIEVLASALQGRLPIPETGMSLFEHSVNLVEAETVVSRMLKMHDGATESIDFPLPNGDAIPLRLRNVKELPPRLPGPLPAPSSLSFSLSLPPSPPSRPPSQPTQPPRTGGTKSYSRPCVRSDNVGCRRRPAWPGRCG